MLVAILGRPLGSPRDELLARLRFDARFVQRQGIVLLLERNVAVGANLTNGRAAARSAKAETAVRKDFFV